MCDTFVVPPQFTSQGYTIFGKNSDREPNEAQAVVYLPRQQYPNNTTVACTYMAIPQVPETYQVVLSKPFWMWGAEMGVNECGLAIGNEAVFTKVPIAKTNQGLTGMDMLRLALERCNSAENALDLILQLLHDYGQDACGGYENKNFFYHNSFIIADTQHAFVLETAGKEWVIERVKGFRSISNGLTIGEEYEAISPNAIAYARKKSWLKAGENFNFAKVYSASLMTWASSCKIRQQTSQYVGQAYEKFSIESAWEILSSHFHDDTSFVPHLSTTKDICMHARGLLCPNQTVGSMVAHLRPQKQSSVWITGTSNPCLSIYKPIYFDEKTHLPMAPSRQYDKSMWWKAEKLHRLILLGILTEEDAWLLKMAIYQLREEIHEQALNDDFLFLQQQKEGNRITSLAFQVYQNQVEHWLTTMDLRKKKIAAFPPLFHFYWSKQNRKAGIST
jgi:dipeptidase